jgi:uncharacterized membrane protein YccC
VAARSVRIDRPKIAPLFGLRVALVIGALLTVWLAAGMTYAAIWFALGAQFTAMTDPGGPIRVRVRNMAIGAFVAGFSACVGSLVLPSMPAQVIVVAAWGVLAALGTAMGEGRGKIGVVAAFSLLGATAQPTEGIQPLLLVLAVVGGGALQIVAAVLWRASGPFHDSSPPTWAEVRARIGWRTPIGRHAIRMALGLAAAVIVYDAAELTYGVWAGITVLLILRPSLVESADRTLMRMVGTLLAVIVVTGLAAIAGFSPITAIVLVALSEGVSFAFARAQYGIQAGALGAAMVVLFALTGISETELAGARIIDTLVGCLIAAAVTLLIREPRPTEPVG